MVLIKEALLLWIDITGKKEGGKTRSFFKAYELIRAGITFDCELDFDEEILSPELAEWLIHKSGQIGVGAFRERFGKFRVVKIEEVMKAA